MNENRRIAEVAAGLVMAAELLGGPCRTEEIADERSAGGAHQLALGFIPLVDCAPLVVAAEKGFAAAEGLDLDLVRETSWANIRDRVMLGHFDAAHMLGPLPIASTLGIGAISRRRWSRRFSLGLGGNAITVSAAALERWQPRERRRDRAGGDRAGAAQASSRKRRDGGRKPPLTFAMVYPVLGAQLRAALLAGGGRHRSRPRRAARRDSAAASWSTRWREGQIDGFCVGEPWNSARGRPRRRRASSSTKSALWRQGPEKVLGCRADFAERRPRAALRADPRALRGRRLGGDPANHASARRACWRARPMSVARPRRYGGRSPGTSSRAGRRAADDPRLLSTTTRPTSRGRATRCGSTRRWCAGGRLTFSAEHAETARRVYRPDLYRAALEADRAPTCPMPAPRSKARSRDRHRLPRAWAGWCSGRTASSTDCCSIPTMCRSYLRRLRAGAGSANFAHCTEIAAASCPKLGLAQDSRAHLAVAIDAATRASNCRWGATPAPRTARPIPRSSRPTPGAPGNAAEPHRERAVQAPAGLAAFRGRETARQRRTDAHDEGSSMRIRLLAAGDAGRGGAAAAGPRCCRSRRTSSSSASSSSPTWRRSPSPTRRASSRTKGSTSRSSRRRTGRCCSTG